MAVTVITQALTTVVNSRGKHLQRGLADLLGQIDPALTETLCSAIASQVLTHPLVSGSAAPIAPADGNGVVTRIRRLVGGARLGNVVHREEFTKLLMGLAAGEGTSQLPQTARAALVTAMANNGIANPDATLKSIRTMALQLERSAPELSTSVRQNAAILHAAESDMVAKINNWFDQTMDRTSQRFTASTRAITFAGAFIVAFGLQVDTPSIANRLAADDALRAEFVREANTLNQQHQEDERKAAAVARAEDSAGAQEKTPQAAAPAPAEPVPVAPAAAPRAPIASAVIEQQYRAFLLQNGIIKLPTSGAFLAGYDVSSCLGMLVTALLLSLGAPFWYTALGQLLQLRSVLAFKDDAQRTQRQSNEPPSTPPAASARTAPPTVPADRGDLATLE